MKRNKIALAATSGLVGLSVLAGSMAFASTGSDAKSAEELQQFLNANPQVAAVVADVENKTGGKVTEAQFDDETKGNGIVEFDVMMANGSEKNVSYSLADGSMAADVDQHDDDGDMDADHDNDGGENEADDDK